MEATSRMVEATKVEPPAGFRELQGGIKCRCIRLWKDPKGGNYWCCNPKTNMDVVEPKAEQEQPVVELVPDQSATAEKLKSKFEHALHDVCEALDAIEAAGLHGQFQLAKGHCWQIQAMIVSKHL